MEHFIALVTKPDNVPIVAILFLITLFHLAFISAGTPDGQNRCPLGCRS